MRTILAFPRGSTGLRRGIALAVVAVLGAALAPGIGRADQNQSYQACVGASSESGGTWTFNAGSASTLQFLLPSVNPSETICSLGTTTDTGIPPAVGTPSVDPTTAPILSGDMDPVNNASWAVGEADVAYCETYTNALPLCHGGFQEGSLADSTLTLTGSGDFSCANGGNGTLTSPSLSDEIASPGSNVMNSNVDYGFSEPYSVDNNPFVVWSATFTSGVGQLTGILSDGGNNSVPVTGVIVVDCNDPTGGSAPNTASVLGFANLPTTNG